MKTAYALHAAQFFTATIYEWQPVFTDDKYKNIIIESLQFLSSQKRIELNAFVIMRNHIHLIWQTMNDFTPSDIQASFMKYTAQQIKQSVIKDNTSMLANLKVNKYDREYQVWKREPLSIELITESMLIQKLEYIHYNPVSAGLCKVPEDYYYSSAKYYFDGTDHFKMLTHFSGN